MVPLVPMDLPDLHGKEVLIQSGSADPMGSVSEIERLVKLLGKTRRELRSSSIMRGMG